MNETAIKGVRMRYTVILEPEEEGGYHVWCPALKGCHSQGETKEEALANIREAIAAYLESLRDEGLPLPADVVTQQVDAAA
jgi:predicted RNase H-like HicB family nuclease